MSGKEKKTKDTLDAKHNDENGKKNMTAEECQERANYTKMRHYMLYMFMLLILGFIISRLYIRDFTAALRCTGILLAGVAVVYCIVMFGPKEEEKHVKCS